MVQRVITKAPLATASGDLVRYQPLSDAESQRLLDKRLELLRVGGVHKEILDYLIGEVRKRFGETGLNEFYRGAHMVFNGDQIYRALFQMGKGIAATSGGRVERPTDVMTKSDAAGTSGDAVKEAARRQLGGAPNQIGKLTEEELATGKMMLRRPEHGETSHYKGMKASADFPQLGIDFPLSMKGHLLFGIVPGTHNTFVQTEGAGFQDLNEHVIEHGKGAAWNMTPLVGGWQTGLIGHTKASEKGPKPSHYEEKDQQWVRADIEAQNSPYVPKPPEYGLRRRTVIKDE